MSGTRRTAELDVSSPGDLMVQLVRQLTGDCSVILATMLLEEIFSGEHTVEDLVLAINRRGLIFSMELDVELPMYMSPEGEVETAFSLNGTEPLSNELSVKPGILATAEAVPAQADVDDDGAQRPS